MEYDAKDLLSALPLVKDVTPRHLHTYRTRNGIVSVESDLSKARPILADSRMGLDGVLIPLGKVRRLLQLWPKGERVEAYVGSCCPLVPRLGLGKSGWKATESQRFVMLRGGRFECRLYEVERFEYQVSKGNWQWSSREEHLKRAEREAHREDWHQRLDRFRRENEREREVLRAVVGRKVAEERTRASA